MLLGFSARVRAEPRAAGSYLSLSACPWEMLLGFSARVRANPRPAGACFPLPGCPLEVIPKIGLDFSAGSRQSPELLVLVFTFLLVLGQGWKLSCSVCQAECTPGICWDLWSWGRAVLWSSCNQAVAFHCFRDWKYLEFSNPWGQARATPGSAGSRVFPAWSSHLLTSCSHQYNQL